MLSCNNYTLSKNFLYFTERQTLMISFLNCFDAIIGDALTLKIIEKKTGIVHAGGIL